MSKVVDCVADVVEACSTGDEAASLDRARDRIDRYFDELNEHLKARPNQDGSREASELQDRLTAASEAAARRGALTLSDRLERCIDHARKKAGKG